MAGVRRGDVSTSGRGEVRRYFTGVEQGGDRRTSLSLAPFFQGLGCLGLNACQGSSCLLSRGADTSKVSADSTFPHAAGGRIPGQSGDQRRGMPEVSIQDAVPPTPLFPGIRHLLPGCEERASHLDSILGFYKPGLAQSPSMDEDPGEGGLPLRPNAFSKAWFFSPLPSGDLSPTPHDDPWEMCGGAGDACLSLVLPRGTWVKGITPT